VISLLAKLPFFKRLIPSIIKRLKLKINYKKNGIIYYLDLSYLVDRRFYLDDYENNIITHICKIVKNNNCDYFLDIGSCWGLYSLQIAKKNPSIKVIAFDVYKNNILRLENSKIINNINNIECINIAVGAERKIETFSVESMHSPNYAKDLNGKYKIEVQQDTIDNIVSLKNKKITIKIDVERVEIDVLKGANSLLRNNKCFIVVETENIETSNYLMRIGYKKLNDNFDPVNLFFSNF
jgi:FkbM family methyltransferase